MRPVQSLAGPKRRGSPAAAPSSKRARVEGSVAGDDEDIEQLRRESSRAPSVALGSEVLGGRASMGPGLEFGDISGNVEDFQMDIPEEVSQGLERRVRSKSVLSDLSRMSTPVPENAPLDEGEESYADVTCPIATFDDRGSQSQDAGHDDGKGYSKNTVKALRIIRQELQPVPEEPDKVISFKKMSEKASRRAASSFFFELLVLGTRDCINVGQADHYDNIEIRAKNKLWERQRHTSVAPSVSSALQPGLSQVAGPSPLRRGSVAPSIGSTLGL